jgi:type II secretory ATPase GspE/PulE/Tfp pilus assembly ATPase PilB-like protein
MEAVPEKYILDEEGKAILDRCYASPESAPEILDVILRFSIGAGASDILLEPQQEAGVVRVRIDGILYLVTKIPANLVAAVVSRAKIITGLDVMAHSGPQEGKILYEYDGRQINVRVAIAQVVNGDLVVMRLHDSDTTVYPLETLGLEGNNLATYRDLLKFKSGLILVCGPTGSGKTSTLYSSLQLLNTGSSNLVSVEDPVEYVLNGTNQMQVDREHGMGFSEGLRVMLRLNPDIIFVGEIRDGETAHIAIESALTGHLVLSTMHTNNAVGAIFRLLDLDVEKFFINAALIGVVSQRLVRRVCPHCAAETALTAEESQFYQQVTGKVLAVQMVGKGCAECSMTGYRGRVGMYEVLKIDDLVRSWISRNATEQQIKAALAERAFVSILSDGMHKVDQRATTVKEVMSNIYVS